MTPPSAFVTHSPNKTNYLALTSIPKVRFDRGCYSGDGYPVEDADPDPDAVGVQRHLRRGLDMFSGLPLFRAASTGTDRSQAGTSGPFTPRLTCTFVDSTWSATPLP